MLDRTVYSDHPAPSTLGRLDPPIAPASAVWLAALLSLAPFLLGFSQFKKLFFFGDSWDLLSQLADVGFLRWTLLPYAENFVPLFKILWGGAVLLFHGSYLALMQLLWLTHFVIIATFGTILRRLGFGTYAVVISMLTCGLAWTSIEELAWSVQWAALLATLFFLLAWRLLIHLIEANKWTGLVAAEIGLYVLLLIASALSFSRGVIGGWALALFVILGHRSAILPGVRRSVLAVSCALPIILVTLVYVPLLFSTLRLPPPQSHYREVLGFAAYTLFLNPLFDIVSLNVPLIGVSATTAFGLLKAAIILGGFSRVQRSRKQVAFFGALLLFDVMSCALLGVGRSNTGIAAAVGSRYQYVSLICLAPFLGVLVQPILRGAATRLDKIAATTMLLAWGALLTYRWPVALEAFGRQRGTMIRRAIDEPDHLQDRFAFAFANKSRAAQLKAKYNLH